MPVKKILTIKLKAALLILALAVLAAFFILALLIPKADGIMGMIPVSGEQAEALVSGKEEFSAENTALDFNGAPVAYDKYENCFYVCQELDTPSWEGYLTGENGEALYILEEALLGDKGEAVGQAHEFKTLCIDGERYCSFGIVFTALPTVSFQTEKREGDDLYGSISIADTTGESALLRPYKGYARLHEKKKKDNVFSHINYGLHLMADSHYLRKMDAELFGLREDDDWELDSVMESEFAVNEMLAGRIWNSICEEDGYSGFRLDMVYSYVFVDNRKSGLYLVRVPYDKKSLGLGGSDSLEECDSVAETDLSGADIDEFIDYSIFIETVYAPKNMVKNKFVLRRGGGSGGKCYRLPRHLEYLFNNLPDDLTEYTLNVADSYEKYIVGDNALQELIKQDPAILERVKEQFDSLRGNRLSEETVIGALKEEISYLTKTGYFARSSVEDVAALSSTLEEYLRNRLKYLDRYYANGMQIPKEEPGPGDIAVCFGNNRSKFYVSGNECVLFLPGWARKDEVKFELPEGLSLRIGDTRVENGQAFDLKRLTGGPEIEIRTGSEEYRGRLSVMFSDKVYSMFINTASGSIDYILSDISHKESGSVRVYDPYGMTDTETEFKSFKGHGRSSWVNELEKKSYNLNFDTATEIAGLGKTEKYCLISNVYDGSFMRNYITYMMAENSDLKYTPRAEFTELYINGDYCGLYLLSEKNIIGEDRVDIADLDQENQVANPEAELKTTATEQWSGRQGIVLENEPEDISGGYLIEGNLSHHPVTGFFNTDRGYRLEIVAPEYPSTGETEYIYDQFQQLEDAVYAEDGICEETGRHYEDYMDSTSFADKYLVDEISKNYDSVKYSAFYYKDRGNDRLYAGPVWDYDIAYGNTNLDDEELNSPDGISSLLFGTRFEDNIFSELLKKKEFKNLVEERYTQVFEPFLNEHTEEIIDAKADVLKDAAAMDDKRYEAYKKERGKEFEVSVRELKEFIAQRKKVTDKEFLNR